MDLKITTLYIVLALPLSACSFRQKEKNIPCSSDPSRLESRSRELQEIVKSDQEDRKEFHSKNPEELQEMSRLDVIRRKRVGEIFGEGCFSKARDYAAAALIYQHGDTSDHFFQAFLWAKKAVELGDHSQKALMAFGVDRYLVNIGKKQLFGSQATKASLGSSACWCLEQVEESIPDKMRKNFAGRNLKEALAWVQELNAGKECPARQCERKLDPTPKGTVPGFW